MRLVNVAGPDTGKRPHRGLVLAAASLGFGVIQLDVSVVNVSASPAPRRPRAARAEAAPPLL
ncbi:MAG: hypothetical protein ACRDOH_08575, partial [Streptosporangiaceae bacterium]